MVRKHGSVDADVDATSRSMRMLFAICCCSARGRTNSTTESRWVTAKQEEAGEAV